MVPLPADVRALGQQAKPRRVLLPGRHCPRVLSRVARGGAGDTVGLLRAELGRSPTDPETTDLIERLLDGSAVFRRLWSAHDVRRVLAETKRFAHPEAGPLKLALEAFDVSADPGLTLVAYAAAPGSPSEEGLSRLRRTVSAFGSGR